jgi:periplasmic copper chaperone A
MRKLLAIVLFIILYFPALGGGLIKITDSWVREVPPVSSVTAVYMVIENAGDTDDKLVDVKSEASKSAEVHSTKVDENYVATMEKIDALPIASGERLELKPGGSHIMLRGLKKPLKVGDKVDLDLIFEKSGVIRVEADVKNDLSQ